MLVHQLSTSDFVKITRKSNAREVLQLFLNKKQDLACVIENGKLLGIVTKYSLYRLLLEAESLDATVESVIKKSVVTVHEDKDVYFAKNLLIKMQVGHAVIVNSKGKVTGIMAKSDLIRGLITETNNLVNRLKSLVNHLQEAVISVDLKMHVTSVNAITQSMLQINEEEVLNKSIVKRFPHLAEGLKEAIHTNRSFVKRIQFPNTTTIASFIPIKEWTTITGAMVVLKDVTDFEKAAKELESTKRIEKILDSALELAYDGVVITDPVGKITKANYGLLSLYGYQSLQEVNEKPITKIFPDIPSDKSIIHNKKIEGEIIEIQGKKAILTQMPIFQDGKKIGAIFKVIFQQLEVWRDLFHHMERLENEISYCRGELSKISFHNDSFAHIISNDKKIESLKKEAYIASQTFSNILITGESGTGKELLANGIHQTSGRQGAFIKVNCSAIPEELLESEFFGYVDGAFTGARKGGKPGKFELSDRGTLFLDEIGDMPLSLQAKLLRILQEKEFERIGDTKTTKVDVRILAATNKNLLSMVQKGTFREDLYYRINVIQLHIPPLRERLDDIPLLCEFFIAKFKTKNPKKMHGLTAEALAKLTHYHWPGNVRQLENVLERGFHFSNDYWIDAEHIILDPHPFTQPIQESQQDLSPGIFTPKDLNRKDILNETDKSTLIKALSQTNGNRTKAAKILGISRSTLYQKIKKYRIKEESHYRFGE